MVIDNRRDAAEDENLIITSHHEAPTPTCCIPQSQGIRIIGVISCVSGLFIACLTLWCIQLDYDKSKSRNKLDIDPTRYLLLVGITSALVSVWLLCKEGCRTAAKIWTVFQIFCAIVSIVMFSQLLTETNFESLMQVLLSLAGMNLCVSIFNILVMIEFLLHPNPPKDF